MYVVNEEIKKEGEQEPVAPCPSTLTKNLSRYASLSSNAELRTTVARTEFAAYANFEPATRPGAETL